jgi:hypothetical protein
MPRKIHAHFYRDSVEGARTLPAESAMVAIAMAQWGLTTASVGNVEVTAGQSPHSRDHGGIFGPQNQGLTLKIQFSG